MPQFNKCDLSFVCRKTWETLPETGNATFDIAESVRKAYFRFARAGSLKLHPPSVGVSR